MSVFYSSTSVVVVVWLCYRNYLAKVSETWQSWFNEANVDETGCDRQAAVSKAIISTLDLIKIVDKLTQTAEILPLRQHTWVLGQFACRHDSGLKKSVRLLQENVLLILQVNYFIT